MSEASAVARRAQVPAEEVEEEKGVTRREILNYAWLASLGIFTAQIAGVSYLFLMPRFKEGEFGGVFTIPVSDIPPPDAGPKPVNEGKFWLSSTEKGVLALYKVCTHLGCLYDWAESENKFICPCHGSQFKKDGTYIQGPAPRSLDRFPVVAVDAEGNPVAEAELTGTPDDALKIPENAVALRINTGKRKYGQRHA